MNVQFVEEKNFTHNNKKYSFTIFRLLESGHQPTAIIGNKGDLLLDGDCTWVRYDEGWRKAISGEDDQGRVLQRHPNITGRCLVGNEWKYLKGKPKVLGTDYHHKGTGVEVQTYREQHGFPTASTINSQSEWILRVQKLWDAPSISIIPKLHEVGKRILDKLAILRLLPSPINESLILLLGKPKRSSVVPTNRLVLEDLFASKDSNVTEFISRACETGIGPMDILASMMNPTTYCDMYSSERRLYGALDIPVTPVGVGMCGYVVENFVDGKDNFIPKKAWTTTFTPPGAITHTHMDFYGRYQYIVHLFGYKVWLLWPPTPKNLEKLWSNHTQYADPDLTERCIDEMEGLQIFYATEEQIVVLKPNVLHACMSVSTCGHSATWFWRLETYQESLRMVEWGLDWLKAKVSSDAPRSDYEEGIKTLEEEMKVWRDMVKRNSEMKELKLEVDRLDVFLKEVVSLFKPVKGKDGRIYKGKKRPREE